MYENIPPTNPTAGRSRQPDYAPDYRSARSSGGWIWVAGIAVLAFLALIVFGADGDGSSTGTAPAADPAAVTNEAAPADGAAAPAAGDAATTAPAD